MAIDMAVVSWVIPTSRRGTDDAGERIVQAAISSATQPASTETARHEFARARTDAAPDHRARITAGEKSRDNPGPAACDGARAEVTTGGRAD